MEDLNNHREIPDDFSRAIQERLKEYRLPLEDAGWEEMEKKWQTEQSSIRKKRMIWIAAAIIPLFLLFPFWWYSHNQQKDFVLPEINRSLSEEISSSGENQTIDIAEEPFQEQPLPVVNSLPALSRTVPDKKDILVKGDEEKSEPEPEESQEPEESPGEPASPSFYDPVLVPRKGEGTLIVAYRPVKKRSSSWQIGAGLGTGGGVSLNFERNDYAYQDKENPPTGPSNPNPPPVWQDPDNEIMPGHYNDNSYSLPFSIQLSVRKQFNKWIGIETGLQYSYLSTRFYSSSNNLREARSDLHYLGIPVNLVVTAWREENWTLYFSAGTTFEKGIRQTIRKYGRPGPFPDDTSVGKSIPGVQWSFNIAPGISYRIFKDWNLYIEPRFSYFFDNDQPYSIRTDKPTVIGVAGGLRYSF